MIRAPRKMLFHVLKRLGCGSLMISALVAMCTLTESWIGTALVTVAVGVKQGSPTPCILFAIFVIIKQGSNYDGFLRWLHMLVMMDDTVLLSTSRNNMLKKLSLLQEYCIEYGMRVKQSKTKFFVLSGGHDDARPLEVNGLTVEA